MDLNIVVGLGEWACSNNKADTIITYALSSCVAVTAYCPIQKTAGMIHIVLPSPYTERDAQTRPGHFATTGVPLLINKMTERFGCRKESLEVHLYGGASSSGRKLFQIGSQNIIQVHNTLLKLNVKPRNIEVGGNISRTLEMSVETGQIVMRTQQLAF